MFDERAALKIRLEQLSDSELKIIRELRKEREDIFKRLNELDAAASGNTGNHQEIMAITTVGAPPQERKRRGRRSESLNELRSLAVRILKKQNLPIRGVELQKQIEEESNKKIANMTTFMVGLERENSHVRKLGRGLYIYEYED